MTVKLFPDGRTVSIDISHWQPNVNFDLLKSAGISTVIIKISQGDYYTDLYAAVHIRKAYEAGLNVEVYHWDDPIVKPSRQSKHLLKVVAPFLPMISRIWIDSEQEWASWIEYQNHNIVHLLDPNVIANSSWSMRDTVFRSTGLPVGIYTRWSFVQAYAKSMADWLHKYESWMASYPYSTTHVTTTWEKFFAMHLPATAKPTGLPANLKLARWQFTGDKFHLPGVYRNAAGTSLSPVDVNFDYPLSEVVPTNPEEPTQPKQLYATVKVPARNKRVLPWGRITGWYTYGNRFIVIGRDGDWVCNEKGEWIWAGNGLEFREE